jgi:hypothetical protein
VDCELLLIVPFFFIVSSKDVSLVLLTKVYYFSRKSLSKYLMDTIDFNKHDIDIFINLVKIVRYGWHCNEWRLLFSSSSRKECTHTWVLILRAWPNCTGKNQSYIQLKTDCYLHLGLHWESDRPKSCSELVDGRDQSKFLRYVTPGEYGTREEGVFISVNSGVDYSIYSSSSGSSIGWYK